MQQEKRGVTLKEKEQGQEQMSVDKQNMLREQRQQEMLEETKNKGESQDVWRQRATVTRSAGEAATTATGDVGAAGASVCDGFRIAGDHTWRGATTKAEGDVWKEDGER